MKGQVNVEVVGLGMGMSHICAAESAIKALEVIKAIYLSYQEARKAPTFRLCILKRFRK